MNAPSQRLTLRDLPLAARLTLAAVLISIGIGYFSALIQLHFQHAKPGSVLPTPEDSEDVFHGKKADPASHIERLLTADEGLPFNGQGQMAEAFTTRSVEWGTTIKGGPEKEKQVRAEREAEKEAMLAWLRAGASEKEFKADRFTLPKGFPGKITDEFVAPPPVSQIQRLVEADEKLKLNGAGQMSVAFTTRAPDFKPTIRKKAKELAKGGLGGDALNKAAEAAVRKEREGEKAALVAWIKAGAALKEYKEDSFQMPAGFNGEITTKFVKASKKGEPPVVKIKKLIDDRCVRCHNPEDAEAGKFPLETFEQIKKYLPAQADSGPAVKIKTLFEARCTHCHNTGTAEAGKYPLESYEQIKPYTVVKTSSAMSLTKLAQTTHVHLLGFSMLYGITGLILAFTSLPGYIRIPLAPLPLIAQVVDISFWWLARLDEPYGPLLARAIPISGAVVAAGLGLHILLSLFDLFGRVGKLVLIVLIGLAGAGAYVAKEKVIDPHMAKERATVSAAEKK
jgi:hypothetical protein